MEEDDFPCVVMIEASSADDGDAEDGCEEADDDDTTSAYVFARCRSPVGVDDEDGDDEEGEEGEEDE